MKGMLNTTDELNRRLCLGWSGRRDGGREEAKGGRGRAQRAPSSRIATPRGPESLFPGRRAAAAAFTP